MNRIVILAAAAAALVAGSASAEVIRISTVGKSPEQVKAEVHKAAQKACQAELPGYAFRIDEARACVDHTERDTFARAQTSVATVAAR
ncbi:MAG: hypothetical protein JSR98_13155 [Proteobacteria bacterium]|nr:hypothetical protein [Pseudomonadota bacterium]